MQKLQDVVDRLVKQEADVPSTTDNPTTETNKSAVVSKGSGKGRRVVKPAKGSGKGKSKRVEESSDDNEDNESESDESVSNSSGSDFY